MKATFKTRTRQCRGCFTEHVFNITAEYMGKAKKWGCTKSHFNITIEYSCWGTDYKKPRTIDFDFYMGDGTVFKMSDTEVLEAFENFVSECTYADMDIDEFQSEFGYEKASELLSVYNAIKEERKSWNTLGCKKSLYSINNDVRKKLGW